MLITLLIILWAIAVFVFLCIRDYRRAMYEGDPELLETVNRIKREWAELKRTIRDD